MTPEQHQRVKALFMAACEMSPAERRAFLDRECADDGEVRAEVEGLLGHDSDPHASLKTPALGLALTTVLGKALPPTTKTVEVPERVGPYRIQRALGVGGMGVVYLAQQDRPRRVVALKVLAPGRRAASLVKRFEHEAELLGRLRHPGIAQIFESGLAGEGPLARPFIAMEYIDGRPLNEFALKYSLTVRQRVDLMIRVCDAVQHAHQRGVIHRDLKPANILVDDSGQPKVLDFGVARATDADLQLTSLNTDVGQMVGTLPYMSPEQVTGDPREIDTRSDVYALGVCLYQLLTERLPFEPAGRSLPELARIIRDDSPARLSSIVRTLRGDLDTIVSKAMEKDKPRRYQSAAALADDLRRFLAGEPIAAKGDSALYVIGKQIQRHKGPVAAALVGVLGLLVFSVYASVQATENKRLAREAEEARRAEAARANEAETASRAAEAAQAEALRSEARAEEELELANIQRGRMAVQAGSAPAAEEMLWSAFLRDPSSAAARWGLWEYCARFGARAITQAHRALAKAVVVSTDGSVVYTAGNDGFARAWDAGSLALLGQDGDRAGGVYTLLASPDGSCVVVSDAIVGLRVLDPRTMERLKSVDLHDAWGRAIAFSPDGARLYVGRVDGSLSVFDARTWEELQRCHGHDLAVSALEVARQGWPIATSDIRGNVALWSSLDEPPRVWKAHTDDTPSLAFTRDARYLITGSNDERARVWDTATLAPVATLSAPNGSVRDLDMSGDGRVLFSSGWWGVQTWDAGTWRLLGMISMPATVFEIAQSPDGRVGYGVLEDGTLRSWRIDHGPEVLRLPGHTSRTLGAFSPDGTVIATGDSDGVLRIWDARDGRLLRQTQAHNSRIRTLRFHPTRPWIATCDGAEFTIRDIATLEPVRPSLAVYAISHSSFDFSRDGRLLAVPGRDWKTHVFDALTGEPISEFAQSGWEPVSVRFTPDGRRILLVHRGPRAMIYDLATREQVVNLPLDGRLAWTGDFSADGSTMVLGDWDRELSVWDTRTWTMQRALTGHAGLLYDVAYSPANDGTVASAGAEGTVRLWDVGRGRPLLTLDRFEGWTAHSVSFSPDGSRLLSCNTHNGEVVVWDLHRYDQDIARQVEFQIQRRGPELGASMHADEARAWAASVLGHAAEAGLEAAAEATRGPGTETLDAGVSGAPSPLDAAGSEREPPTQSPGAVEPGNAP